MSLHGTATCLRATFLIPFVCGLLCASMVGCGGNASNMQPPSVTPPPIAPSATLGCQSTSTSYPWGSPLEIRTWTPNDAQPDTGTVANPGVATGDPFQARLVLAYGIDSQFSKQSAVFEFANGCRRQYQTASFSSADTSYIEDQISAHPFSTDTKTYSTLVDPAYVTQAMLMNGTVLKYETQHFAMWYGVQTGNFSYAREQALGVAWSDFLNDAGRWMEQVWDLDNNVLGAPMPYGSDANPKRINIYICGTGLPSLPSGDNSDCGASAAASVFVSSVYMQYGSTTMMHEFTHSIQFYTGGFQGRDSAGPFWETHADWDSSTLSPSFENGVEYYTDNLENGPLWSNSRYGAYPFLMSLYESDSTRGLLWSIWQQNKRDASGTSLEDQVETMVRLGQANGAFPGGMKSFGDDIGWYGARLATMDFYNQKMFLDVYTDLYTTKRFVGLKAGASANNYTSLAERPLYEYGTHIVPLAISGSSGVISAKVTGGTSGNGASWRFTIAGLDANNNPSYAPLTEVDGTGSNSVAINATAGTRYFLVVTATPTTYQSLGWEGSGPIPNQYPYSVDILGATPLMTAANACTSHSTGGQDLNWNTNGHSTDARACP